MDFKDQGLPLASRVEKISPQLRAEEATRKALTSRSKTVLLFICLALQCFTSIGQVRKFGIKAGANRTSFSSRDSLGVSTRGTAHGYQVGAYMNLPYRRFLIQPGLSFISKGGYQNYINRTGPQQSDFKVRYDPKYLEIPLNILYAVRTGKGAVRVGTGGYFAYAIGGSSEGNGILYGQSYSQVTNKIQFGEGRDVYLSRLDYGVNGLINFDLTDQLGLGLNYSYGLSDINPNSSGGNGFYSDVNNRSLGLSIAYMF